MASRDAGSEMADAADGGHQSEQPQEEQAPQQPSPPPPPPASMPPGGYGAGESGDGNGDEPSPNPRAMTLEATDSNGSTTSHNSSVDATRGLAASVQSSSGGGGLSAALLIDSHTSADIGSSIFSSTESGKDTPVVSRHEAERKSRFKELANRRKSGTLERISNSGLVKTRKALLTASEPTSSSSSSSSSKRAAGPSTKVAKVRFAAPAEETTVERSPSPNRFHEV
ncbi:hypothetical protein GGI13_008881, partial [Coemansia sp. RSA 455]